MIFFFAQVSGAIAGAVAAAATTPLDVCKTLLNTQQNAKTRGLLEAIVTVYRLGGPRAYFRGMQARVLYQMPATAICWSTYEFFKYLLGATKMPDPHHTVSKIEDNLMKGSDYVYQATETIALKPSPAVSGAGLYGAISFNTMHKADAASLNCTRRINDPILDITHT